MNARRLEFLANHLTTGKLFNTWNFGQFYSISSCGATGCAIAEAAQLFNNQDIKETLEIHSRKSGCWGAIKCWAMDFFEISEDEFEYLFIPIQDSTKKDSYLTVSATPKQVGASMLDYINSGVFRTRTEEELSELEENEDYLSNDLT